VVITEKDYIPAMEETGRGWVVEDQGTVVGFAIGNAVTGNIWALFVDPQNEGRGHGRRLHEAMIEWLFSQGLQRLWLSTAPNTRAQKFYEVAGWSFVGMLPDGEALYELHAPRYALDPSIEPTARSFSLPSKNICRPAEVVRSLHVAVSTMFAIP
jgi:ribosomal protein S18 acetylase RimI-like enzyme